MNVKDREAFLAWHKEKKDSKYIFDFKYEMAEYCKSDVDILRRCCLKFRSLMIDLPNTENRTQASNKKKKNATVEAVDPFQYITISAVCMAVYKFKFLQKDTLALLTFDGLTTKDQFSKISIAWLDWLMHQSRQTEHPIYIEHAGNIGEKPIGNFKLDGFDKNNQTGSEFLGCFWHWCRECYPDPAQINPKTKIPYGILRQKVDDKETYLKEKHGLRYVAIWECEFYRQMQENEELQKFCKDKDVQERLDPRNAFMGGRTNGISVIYVTAHRCAGGLPTP